MSVIDTSDVRRLLAQAGEGPRMTGPKQEVNWVPPALRAEEEVQPNLARTSLIFSLTIRMPGNSRKVSSEQFEVEADKKMVHASKDLLDSAELKAIGKLDRAFRTVVQNRCLSASFLRGGFYLLPVRLIEEMETQVEKYRAAREALIAEFLTAYPEQREAAARRLGALYNELDYPSEEGLRRAFAVETRYVSFDVPGRLKEFKRELYERESQKLKEDLEAASAEVREALRVSLAGYVEYLADRLKPGPDGKAKIFKNKPVERFQEFITLFEARNVTDDAELSKLVEQAKEVLSGVTPTQLRKSPEVRESVQKAMESLKQEAASMITTGSGRKFIFDDEE